MNEIGPDGIFSQFYTLKLPNKTSDDDLVNLKRKTSSNKRFYEEPEMKKMQYSSDYHVNPRGFSKQTPDQSYQSYYQN
jgi:hypothetical protein